MKICLLNTVVNEDLEKWMLRCKYSESYFMKLYVFIISV